MYGDFWKFCFIDASDAYADFLCCEFIMSNDAKFKTHCVKLVNKLYSYISAVVQVNYCIKLMLSIYNFYYKKFKRFNMNTSKRKLQCITFL